MGGFYYAKKCKKPYYKPVSGALTGLYWIRNGWRYARKNLPKQPRDTTTLQTLKISEPLPYDGNLHAKQAMWKNKNAPYT